MNVSRPNTAQYKGGKARRSGSAAPAMRRGWFNDERLGASGTVPRGKRASLSGAIRKDCTSTLLYQWLRDGVDAAHIRIMLDSDSGAERFAAQRWLEVFDV